MGLDKPYEHPVIYITLQQVKICFSVPVNCFTFYVIMFHTPRMMKDYKIYIAVYQLQASFLELCLELAGPELYFPMTGGYFYGMAKEFCDNYPGLTFLTILFTAGGFCATTMLCFHYRFSQIRIDLADSQSVWRTNLCTTLIFISGALVMMWIWQDIDLKNDDSEYLMVLQQRYPDFHAFLVTMPRAFFMISRKSYDFWVVEWTSFPTFTRFITLMVQTTIFSVLILSYRTQKRLNSHMSGMSAGLRNRQQKFFRALVIQVVVPFLGLIFPVLVIGYVGLYNTDWFGWMVIVPDQGIINGCTVIMCCHGIMSSISILVMYDPYRRFTASLLSLFIFRTKSRRFRASALAAGRLNRATVISATLF
ncbi:unnamed protein product, partial [Mesorhabditis spiculigera]